MDFLSEVAIRSIAQQTKTTFKEDSLLKIRRALISVSEKQGIVELAKGLQEFSIEIIATGGTHQILKNAGIPVTSTTDVTGFPEILDGRVKTLHPHIHAGILAALDNPLHLKELSEHNIRPIDLIVVNLYPFEETSVQQDLSLDQIVEQIDIGGPAMVRAGAKNFRHTAVVVNPDRYEWLLSELRSHEGSISEQTCFDLAREAFQHTAAYDALISTFLGSIASNGPLPDAITVSMRKSQDLRYGENPHQAAALYGRFHTYFRKLHGKELSFNNILDINAAATLSAEFEKPTVVIVKHNNPCGVGSDEKLSEAYAKALATDPKSAFGGIVSVNRPLDQETATAIDEVFTEVVIAPSFTHGVLDLLMKKKDRRIIQQTVDVRSAKELDIRRVIAGLLVQEQDYRHLGRDDMRVVTKRKPTDQQIEAMMFAWRVAKVVKSNAVVYARRDRTLGIGAGQMSRVDSARIALLKAAEAGLDLNGCAVASDAFFPFADGLLEAVKAGATGVIQPGGSVRDDEVIKAADQHDLTMVFTGIRHFRH